MFRTMLIALFVCSVSILTAQDWQDTTNMLGNPIKVVVEKDNSVSKIDKDMTPIWENCKKFTVLENPECRCLPEVQGRAIFFFNDHQVVVVELVQNHWFNLVYLGKGTVTTFLMKDAKNLLWDSVEEAMKAKSANRKTNTKPIKIASAPVVAEEPLEPVLCQECQGKMFAMMMGKCSVCSNTTPSISYKFCAACGKAKGVCCACGKNLK